jgi:hypothetical protein
MVQTKLCSVSASGPTGGFTCSQCTDYIYSVFMLGLGRLRVTVFLGACPLITVTGAVSVAAM